MIISFTVPGEPKGKGRPRFSKTGHAYTPKDTLNYENEVRFEYYRQCGSACFSDDSVIRMGIDAYYGVPKRDSRKTACMKLDGTIRPAKKPDMDNIVKIIADGLNTVAYHDDRQIVECSVRKFYGSEPRVTVTLEDAGIREAKIGDTKKQDTQEMTAC